MLKFYRFFTNSLYSNLIEEVKQEVAREFNINPANLNCKIKILPLPKFYFFKKIGNKLYAFIGKILGAYNPLKKEIYIDSFLWFKSKFNFDVLKLYLKTLAEEFAHRAQHYLGKLKPYYFEDYFRSKVEREAKKVAQKVTKRLLKNYL